MKHFQHEDNDPICTSSGGLATFFTLTDLLPISDERLGRAVKLTPPTEDKYTFMGNYPTALSK